MENPSPPVTQSESKAKSIMDRWQALSTDLQIWRTQWQELADYLMPRKAGISAVTYTPNTNKEAILFDTTGQDAAMTMAGGLMSWTTPANEVWFTFEPVFGLRESDPVRRWLLACSERVQELLANSNFYSENHEDLLNHCTFGTSALYSSMENGRYSFESLPVGSFAIEENAEGEIDTLFREIVLTARQAKEKFGEENLPKKVLDCLADTSKIDTRFTFIHAVYPRAESERPKDPVGRSASYGKAFASCYVETTSKHLVQEGGYDTFPFAPGRYLKWSALGNKSPYGYGPGFAALPDVRQVNHMQMIQDCAAEKAIKPALIADSRLEGEIVLSPGGITYVEPDYIKPEVLQAQGQYQVGEDRIKMRQEAINAKFHKDMFMMFQGLDRQMTAREVAERASEKITLISPAFSRLITEKLTPLLKRLFNLAAENKLLPDPPPEAIVKVEGGTATVADPAVSYNSRLALAIKQLRNIGYQRQMEMDMLIAQARPEILDYYDFGTITKESAANNGMPINWIFSDEKVEEIRAQRAEAQQAAMQMEAMQAGSQVVKNVGGVEQAKQLIGG